MANLSFVLLCNINRHGGYIWHYLLHVGLWAHKRRGIYCQAEKYSSFSKNHLCHGVLSGFHNLAP
jgi:hypothetical protein